MLLTGGIKILHVSWFSAVTQIPTKMWKTENTMTHRQFSREKGESVWFFYCLVMEVLVFSLCLHYFKAMGEN